MDRASAKIILFGEHAVVHGRTAVAAAIDRGATASATPSAGPARLTIRPWGTEVFAGGAEDLARAFQAVLEASGATELPALDVCVDVGVPAGAGLGCSAAIGVAVARAIASARGETIDASVAAARATPWEKVFHGNPSGVDVAVAARGGIVRFRRGEPPRPVHPAAPMEVAVCWTGESASTRSMVEQVARQLSRRPQVVERTFDGIEALALKGIAAIEAARWYEVGHLMDLNHALLTTLMLSTETLERACAIARDAGALGAKLTGGGGGGCAIALAPGKSAEVVAAWERAGLSGFVAEVAPIVTEGAR